jgi:hypothetical protein
MRSEGEISEGCLLPIKGFRVRFWEFPPQEWFEDASTEDRPSCLIMLFCNGLPVTLPSYAASASEIIETLKCDEISFHAKQKNELAILPTPRGNRSLVSYHIKSDAIAEEYYNHIVVMVNAQPKSWEGIEKGRKKCLEEFRGAMESAAQELVLRNQGIFLPQNDDSSTPGEPRDTDIRCMTAAIMESATSLTLILISTPDGCLQ